ncbi:Allergen Asp f 7-like protein [Yarrowia sp. C11]|nr:Allergen Asp f 7-like protein [Yarrowia sp. C11]KAG5370687.1 Allergen Asp f 7-like protein [Yarrowia sp. E02]
MKFSFVSMALLTQVLAAPIALEAGLAKRAIVTVKNTNVVYVKNVVYVDQNGTPYKTEVVPYSTEAQIEQPTQAPEAPAAPAPAAPTTEAPAAPSPTPEAPKSVEQALPAPSPSPANFAVQDEKPEAAPQPTTSEAPAPAPEPTTEAAPAPATTSSEAAPEPSPSAPSTGGGSGDHSGQATFYDTGMGSCGITNTDSDFIVALNTDMWQAGMIDGNPNHNTLCGKQLTAHRGGKSVTVTVTDMCPGCSHGDLDLSPAAFNALASPDEGRVEVTWSWN